MNDEKARDRPYVRQLIVSRQDMKKLREILSNIPREDVLQSVDDIYGKYSVTVRIKKEELLVIKLSMDIIRMTKFRKRKTTIGMR